MHAQGYARFFSPAVASYPFSPPLLSTKARADSIPGLEIEADDVRCTHGSTTSKIDEELIFYAMCRGYTRKEAARMIVTGFFQQIFDRISIDSVRESLGKAIARKVREYE